MSDWGSCNAIEQAEVERIMISAGREVQTRSQGMVGGILILVWAAIGVYQLFYPKPLYWAA